MSAPPRRLATPCRDVAYDDSGAGAVTAVPVHGWLDDPRAWDGVAARLDRAGVRTAAPYVRGFGPTRFRDAATPPETSAGNERFFTADHRRDVLPGMGHCLPREAPLAVAAALALLGGAAG